MSSAYPAGAVRQLSASVPQSTTDQDLVAAEAGFRCRVLALSALAGGTATDLTVNTRAAGAAGAACGPTLALGVRTPGLELGYNPHGWMDSRVGQGLSLTTGAGSAVSVLATVAVYPDSAQLLGPGGVGLLLESGDDLLSEAA